MVTAEELERFFASPERLRLGDGSRRVCYRLPGTGLCVKSYRSEEEMRTHLADDGRMVAREPRPAVVREIRAQRHSRHGNTSCQEWDYLQELKRRLPSDVAAVFPETFDLVHVPSRGWCLVESEIVNADGRPLERFSTTYRAASEADRPRLLAAYLDLMRAFERVAVRFYDPQNVMVQWRGDGTFRLRIVDFEPASRTLVPLDRICPPLVRMKLRRRVVRYLAAHLGVRVKGAFDRCGVRPTTHAWSAALAEATAETGLGGLTLFLENKYINDVFFLSELSGRPCLVKCSSKCPWSIGNEYALGRRMHLAAPEVVAEPLLTRRIAPGAFVVTERVQGPSLTQLLAAGISDARADAFAGDIRRLAQALKATGIVHRDLFADNLLLGADGHLKAIDWQLAIDRADYREDPWVARHWKFRYVVFGVNRELGLGVWNDCHALGKILAQFPQTDVVKSVCAELAAGADEMTFAAPPQGLDRVRLWLYGSSLRFQMLIRGKRHRKYAQLERRWRTVTGKW